MSKRVLVVDDNEDQAETLAVLLDLAGYDTRTEYSGPAAWRRQFGVNSTASVWWP
jgi:CheY-like chemotaxis protein